MNDKKKRLVERSKRDVAKAGKMFLDAVFGDTDDFLDGLDGENNADNGGDECDDGAMTVQGYSINDEAPPSTKPYGNGN